MTVEGLQPAGPEGTESMNRLRVLSAVESMVNGEEEDEEDEREEEEEEEEEVRRGAEVNEMISQRPFVLRREVIKGEEEEDFLKR